MGERDYAVMHSVVETFDYLTHMAKDKQAAEIYRTLVSSKSEKTRDVLRVLDLERNHVFAAIEHVPWFLQPDQEDPRGKTAKTER